MLSVSDERRIDPIVSDWTVLNVSLLSKKNVRDFRAGRCLSQLLLGCELAAAN